MIYYKMGDEENFSYENFGLGKSLFHAISLSKIEAKFIFVFFLIHKHHIIVTEAFLKF